MNCDELAPNYPWIDAVFHPPTPLFVFAHRSYIWLKDGALSIRISMEQDDAYVFLAKHNSLDFSFDHVYNIEDINLSVQLLLDSLKFRSKSLFFTFIYPSSNEGNRRDNPSAGVIKIRTGERIKSRAIIIAKQLANFLLSPPPPPWRMILHKIRERRFRRIPSPLSTSIQVSSNEPWQFPPSRSFAITPICNNHPLS